jgi:hypothetical protein
LGRGLPGHGIFFRMRCVVYHSAGTANPWRRTALTGRAAIIPPCSGAMPERPAGPLAPKLLP